MAPGLADGANAALGAFFLYVAYLVWRRTSDPSHRGALAVFLGLVAFGYLADGLGPPLHAFADVNTRALRYLSLVAVLLDPGFLIAATLTAGRGWRPWRVLLLGLAPGLAFLALFAATTPADPFMRAWEYRWLFLPYMGLAYAAALVAALEGLARGTRAPDRDFRAAVAVGAALIVLPRLPLLYLDYGLHRPFGQLSPATLKVILGYLAAGTALGAGYALLRTPKADRWRLREPFTAAGAALLVVALIWLASLLPPLRSASFAFAFSGRWFLLAALATAAVRRHRFLDLSPREERYVGRALLGVFLALAFLELAAAISLVSNVTPALALLTAALVLAFTALAVKGYGWAVRGARAEDDLSWRRASLYRAHLLLGTPPERLRDVRERLGIPESEAREVERVAAVELATPPPPDHVPEEGSLLLGRYAVTTLLGVGTFGRILAAHDRVANKPVVIKELLPAWREDPAAVAAFREEALLAMSVQHPNLVEFRAIERIPGGHILILGHVPGITLRERLQTGRPLTPKEARVVALDLLSALDALHVAGLLHRDVKPENVVLRPDGRAVLLDLGAAVRARPTGTQPLVGPLGAGTIAYSAPEQLAGSTTLGPEADVYAAAGTLWEALTGAPHPKGNPPAGWQPVLEAALSRDPRARPATAAAFRARIPHGT
ncbi:MAG TPA: serine/threonine-protein kinase [Candidatus Thermoplasmatota archaeon]|nr:serine/threonine-protein kinase [Candidatus Thermoplasmatota archaeon]